MLNVEYTLTLFRYTDIIEMVIKMNLNIIIKQSGMTKYKVAKLSGVPHATLNDLCSGKSRIEKCSAETLYRIAKALNVSMESLIETAIIEKEERRAFMFTKQDILSQLETFRFAVGHHIHVHSSLKAVGEVEGRGETLLSCLIDFFTKDGGMISFPTHTWDDNILDLNKNETCMGMLSKLALQRGDGVRTCNPTHSMIIFGEGAAEYAKWDEQIQSSVSPDGCYGKLYDADGYILLLGVGQDKNTYIHAAEEALGVPDRVTKELHDTFVIDMNGNRITRPLHLVYEEFGDISDYFGKLEPAFRYHNCIVDGKIGNAPVQFCSVRNMSKVLELIHKRSHNIEIFADDTPLLEEWYME